MPKTPETDATEATPKVEAPIDQEEDDDERLLMFIFGASVVIVAAGVVLYLVTL